MNSEVPIVSGWLQRGFQRFLRPFLKRHFHAIGLERETRCDHVMHTQEPLIVYGNHPSWWDPLMAHFLNRSLFPQRQFYAPIDADALDQYRVLSKLGFYGVRVESAGGAADFLKRSLAILHTHNTAIWITPEGRFADVRDRAATLMPGIAHLCHRMHSGHALPMALEYVFWEERLPVCLIAMGRPLPIAQDQGWTKSQWGEELERELRRAQDRLMKLAIDRCSEPFDNLLQGQAGAGTVYDFFRRLRRWPNRDSGRLRHGDQFE